jgi:hypothetical protein
MIGVHFTFCESLAREGVGACLLKSNLPLADRLVAKAQLGVLNFIL